MKKLFKNILTISMASTIISGTIVLANSNMENNNFFEMEDDFDAYYESLNIPEFSDDEFTMPEGVTIPELPPMEDEGVIMNGLNGMDILSNMYLSQTGTVGSIEYVNYNHFEILIENESGGLRFIINSDTRIIDRETAKYVTPTDIVDGMELTVIYNASTPTAMSIPPFIGSVTGIIANSDKGKVLVGSFNENLLNIDSMIQLNIALDSNETTDDLENSYTTVMSSLSGARIMVTEDTIKHGNSIVFYDNTTKSIPAQTTPTHIFHIPDDFEESGVVTGGGQIDAYDGSNDPVALGDYEGHLGDPIPENIEVTTPYDYDQNAKFIAVRSEAEAKGYNVLWQGFDLPIIVENEIFYIEINLGSNVYSVNGNDYTANKNAEIIGGSLYASINF